MLTEKIIEQKSTVAEMTSCLVKLAKADKAALKNPWKDITTILEGFPTLWTDVLDNGYTLFHLLAEHSRSHRDIIKSFLVAAKDKGLLVQVALTPKPGLWKQDYLNECMIEAAQAGNLDLLKICYSVGAQLESYGTTGKRALHRAAEKGHVAIVNWLLSDSFNFVSQLPNDSDLAPDSYYCVLSNNADSLQLIYVNVEKIVEKITPSSDLVKLLEGKYFEALTDIEKQKVREIVSLYHQNISGLPLGKRCVAPEGVTTNVAKKTLDLMRTPLHLAAEKGHTQVVDKLLCVGASPNRSDKNGQTPLSLAAANVQLNTVKRLLQAGADPNIQDLNGNTPLHLLVLKKHTGDSYDLLVMSSVPTTTTTFTNTKSAFVLVQETSGLTPTALYFVDRTSIVTPVIYSISFPTGQSISTFTKTLYPTVTNNIYSNILDLSSTQLQQATSISGHTPGDATEIHQHAKVAFELLRVGADNVVRNGHKDCTFKLLSKATTDSTNYEPNCYILTQEIQLQELPYFLTALSRKTEKAIWELIYLDITKSPKVLDIKTVPGLQEVLLSMKSINIKDFSEAEEKSIESIIKFYHASTLQLAGDLAEANEYPTKLVKLINKWNRLLRQPLGKMEQLLGEKEQIICGQMQVIEQLRVEKQYLETENLALLNQKNTKETNLSLQIADPMSPVQELTSIKDEVKASRLSLPKETIPFIEKNPSPRTEVWSWVDAIISQALTLCHADLTQGMPFLALSDNSKNIIKSVLFECLHQSWNNITKEQVSNVNLRKVLALTISKGLCYKESFIKLFRSSDEHFSLKKDWKKSPYLQLKRELLEVINSKNSLVLNDNRECKSYQ